MKRPEEVKREFVRQWLRKADDDLAAARHLMGERAVTSLPGYVSQGQTRDEALGTLRAIVRQAGLTVADFVTLLQR